MENPGPTDSSVEEFVRYDGPTNALVRNVAQEHDLHGKMLKNGQRVFLMINSANREPDTFDQPEKFHITRKPNRHMTIGQGIHTCLGSQLAREEGRVAVRALFEPFPNTGFINVKPSEYILATVDARLGAAARFAGRCFYRVGFRSRFRRITRIFLCYRCVRRIWAVS